MNLSLAFGIMRKLLIAFLTFTVGILAVNLSAPKRATIPTPPAIEKKAAIVLENKSEIISTDKIESLKPSEKNKNLKPFFDSFSADNYDENGYQGYSGWLMADDFKGMKEVWTILLSRDNENDKSEKLVWSAMVLTQNADGSTNDEDNFQSVWIETVGNHLSFRTNKIRGIEYKFDGIFFKKGKEFSNDEKVLKGTLRKIVKGNKIAEFTADFSYQEPVCFH